MIWIVYNILFAVGFTLMLPHFIYRMVRRGGYARNFVQRLGFYSRSIRTKLSAGRHIWIQAVSVGEIFVAFRFMEEIRRRNPDARFVLSTNTSTGYALARSRIGESDILIYFPVDFPLVMRRVLGLINPAALILVECELWPNLIRLAKRRGTPVLLVNGRISEHSFRGYRKLKFFTKKILPMVDLLCAQSAADARRLISLGAPERNVKVMGSAKYEVASKDPTGEEKAAAILKAAGIDITAPILLGGSTWAGEEKILLNAFKILRDEFKNLQLVLAPRHAERAGEVIHEIESAGCRAVQRSKLDLSAARVWEPDDVLLVDSTGELKNFYPYATVIFIGKSLTQHGGQNPIEPAVYGKPVIVGPNMENFPVVMEDFREASALIQVADETGLHSSIRALLSDAQLRGDYGGRAASLVEAKSGALAETVELIIPHLLKS
ncbi:MAG TPA: 3-deoxy-D-manno-octulosonic acid transferase [Kiritimatiellia bacterium]|nr:3-deoxy-D-manno-octulosonic acid transferase [Kiritimatiellia bacterium]HPA79049.1 3-deoxy-D-manno-octulosonic acid transferase [Kiritimatiellia bacterium]HQQ04735.1 3-deoxy-D-manno-octulosonic acid transferase [Kiritimatiellia bacterium]